jgi:predicted TIM-barrel fold metal-dependent hydrolase
VGADHVLWASDFPHPDAAYPDAVDEFLEKTAEVPDADLRAVLWDTPVRFYKLEDRFAPVESRR